MSIPPIGVRVDIRPDGLFLVASIGPPTRPGAPIVDDTFFVAAMGVDAALQPAIREAFEALVKQIVDWMVSDIPNAVIDFNSDPRLQPNIVGHA